MSRPPWWNSSRIICLIHQSSEEAENEGDQDWRRQMRLKTCFLSTRPSCFSSSFLSFLFCLFIAFLHISFYLCLFFSPCPISPPLPLWSSLYQLWNHKFQNVFIHKDHFVSRRHVFVASIHFSTFLIFYVCLPPFIQIFVVLPTYCLTDKENRFKETFVPGSWLKDDEGAFFGITMTLSPQLLYNYN